MRCYPPGRRLPHILSDILSEWVPLSWAPMIMLTGYIKLLSKSVAPQHSTLYLLFVQLPVSAVPSLLRSQAGLSCLKS